MPSSRWWIGQFCLSESKCTVSARILRGFKTCRRCFSLQNPTKGAETPSQKPAMYRIEVMLKRNFQKLRESPGVRYESVGPGFESLEVHRILNVKSKDLTLFLYVEKRLHTFCTPFVHLPESGAFLRMTCTACLPLHENGTCRGEAPPSCCARPFCRLKAPLGLSLLHFANANG